MSDSSEGISHVLYVLAFDCPLPPLLSSIPAMCRFAAATLAIPFVFCVLLDLVAYCAYLQLSFVRERIRLTKDNLDFSFPKFDTCRSVIARTLHLSPRDIRLSRSSLNSKMRGKPISSEIPATAMTQPEVVQASVHTTRDSLDQEPLDSLPEVVAPLQYSPLSTATSVSSSSASVVSSSDSSDEGDIAHRAYNADLYSRTNSLGLMDEFADEQAFQSQLSNLQRRQPFSYEDDSQGVSREKTPRTFDTTPSINSVDEQGLLVPSSLGSSTSTSDTEFDDPGNDPMQFGVTHAGGTILAPRQTEDKHTTTEMESAASAETVLLGSPVQT